MDLDAQFLREFLKRGAASPAERLRVEKLGDKAFDEVLELLAGAALSERERVNALRLLSLLSRQFCFRRKAEVLDEALRKLDDPSVTVRSAAAHLAVSTMHTLERLPHLLAGTRYAAPNSPTMREVVTAAVERALDQRHRSRRHRE